jgi:hypothetical protein
MVYLNIFVVCFDCISLLSFIIGVLYYAVSVIGHLLI